LALSTSTPVVGQLTGVDLGTAQAADDRGSKEERRVLKASEMDNQTLSQAYRVKAREKRHESMAFLKDILANRAPQGTQKAEMMLRLAELYFEEHRDIYLDEMLAYQTKYDECFNTPDCNTEGMEADTAVSDKWASRAIKLYRQILDNYPQYQRADEATYFLASALQDTKKRDDAVQEFTRLVRTYPESAYIPDAYVQIGEYYFDKNNAYKALLAYQKATRYKNSGQYAFASYKLAWCYYNVGEYGKAIETMKGVVAFSMTANEGGNEKKRLTLQDEALKDLVRFFADAGEMDEAYQYFNKLGKKELIRAMLKRLASTYFEQGKFEMSIQTYRRLIAEDPQGTDAPEYQNDIVQSYQKMGRKKETLGEIDRLLKSYGQNSAWARTNSADQDALKDAQNYIEKNLRTVAINYHNEAKKLGTGKTARETYALAEKAYSVYLQEFPDGKHAYQMRYAFGELLYKLKKFDESYEQYMAVVKIDANGQHSKFCAESAIFAAEEMTKRDKKEGNGPKLKGVAKTEQVPLTGWEQRLIDACDQFAKLYKDDKKTRNIIYKSAYTLYNHNMFKDASDRFRIVIGMNPKSKEAEQAANLILDSFALVEDWTNLKDVSKAFYDQEGLGSTKFKKEVYNIYERASFKFIETAFAKDKDEVKAAGSFMAFYAEFPESEVADLSLNNAAVYYYKQSRVKDAMGARIALIENFPKSKYYNDQVSALGYDYESVADFASAAIWYEKLFGLDKAHEGAKEALYSAALFRKALDQNEAAVSNYGKFLTEYGDDKRVPNIMIDIAQIFEGEKKWNEASTEYYKFFSKPPEGASLDQVFFARLQYGLALEAQSKQSKADAHWNDTLAAYTAAKDGGGEMKLAVEFVAQIMFKKAQPELEAYMAMKISGPDRKMSQKKADKFLMDSLVGKAKALQSVEATFVEIVRTGAGEWGLAALIQLGKAYENMAEALVTSYIPDYLNTDQVEIYKMGLEDKAYVQTEKAVNVYAQALTKSYELHLYNDNTAYGTRRLGELRPDEYPVLEESVLDARFTATAASDTSFEDTP
jgi:tetratricopeptide (TPR) repeat protein